MTHSNTSRKFTDHYVLGKTLGRGNGSVVRKCRHKFSRTFYAAKIITLEGDREESLERKDMVENEVKTMRQLNHDNVLQFVDVFTSQDKYIIITHLNELGDLHDYISKQDKINESLARLLALDVCAAVNYLHSKKLVHRDIKPENFLMIRRGSMNETLSVQLCDFELTVRAPTSTLSRICGSPSYVAPEILANKRYGLPVDVWSMGIVFYFIICRFCPYEHENLRTKFDLILANELTFPLPVWEGVSGEAKDLIVKMLKTDPLERILSNAVIYDKWFQTKNNTNKPSVATKSKSKRKVTLKTAASVVVSSNALMKHMKSSREEAILTPLLLRDTCSP